MHMPMHMHMHMPMHMHMQARMLRHMHTYITCTHTHHACMHANTHAVWTRKRSKRSVQSQASIFQVLLKAGRVQEVAQWGLSERARVNERQRELMLSLLGTGQACLVSST